MGVGIAFGVLWYQLCSCLNTGEVKITARRRVRRIDWPKLYWVLIIFQCLVAAILCVFAFAPELFSKVL
jgi:hypothetical protein